MNNDYNSPSLTPTDNSSTTNIQLVKENNDGVFLTKSNETEVIFPKDPSVVQKKKTDVGQK